MGSGKSTIGKKLAKMLGYKFIDTDDEIELLHGKEIRHMFTEEGEAWFRAEEENTIAELIEKKEPAVISLGGGALISDKTLDMIVRNGILVHIFSSPENIYLRIKHSTRRPLLRSKGEELSREQYLEKINTLLNEREKGYSAAHIILDRDNYDANEAAKKLKSLINKQ